MKRIVRFFVLGIIFLIVLVSSLLVYVNIQKDKAYADAISQLDGLFIHENTDVYPLYYGCESRFVKSEALSETGSLFKDIIDPGISTPKMPSDISSIYYVAPQNPNWHFTTGIIEDVRFEVAIRNNHYDTWRSINGIKSEGIWQTGWALGVRENFGEGYIVEYLIIPYAIGFRKSKFASLENHLSIDNTLDNSFKFFTENDKSDLKTCLVSNNKKFGDVPHIKNDYYYLKASNDANFITTLTSNFADYNTYMYNDYFYVFIKAYGKKMYEVTLNEEKLKEARISILICGLLGLFILAIIFVVLYLREKRVSNQSIYDRLLFFSNPQRFIKKYNTDKLSSANDIYNKALSVSSDDETSVIELVSRLEKELGVIFISKRELDKLETMCNPKRFMKPYDAIKVAKANELYNRVKHGITSYSEYVELKNNAQTLIQL
jgi:hypothetical protein